MKYNLPLIIGTAYIAGWTGIAIGDVGQVPKDPMAPYPEWLPILMFISFGIPFVLGILASRNKD
jgi:hypothetical protein